ncbi:hypothetical protein BZZ01_12150 [Nostocales cyanobacterium HT-58-2]|nr:hypothetical protein BZZ01_12150 [Nostocales cyanobacterium HT-58-2]
MATLLITVPAVFGELLPVLSVAEGLVKRGHRVLVHTEQHAHDKVRAAGAELVPMPASCNLISRLKKSSGPVPPWIPGFIRPIWRFRSEVLTMTPELVSELEPIIKREQVDCLIGDNLSFGAAYAAERLGIPFVTISASWVATLDANGFPAYLPAALPPAIARAAINFLLPLHRIRKQLGLPQRPKTTQPEFLAVAVSKLLNLVVIHEEFIPSKQLQENQVFIGPTVFQMPRTTDTPPYGESLDPDTVLISSTTSPGEEGGVFRRAVESVAQLGVPILAVSGSATDLPSGLGENVRLETFVPFDEVLPYVKAIITHGGAGTVGRALRLGIPMLILSGYADSPATGSRAEELGLAYHLPKNKATPKAIQSKFKALLQDHALHARVKSLSMQLRSMNSPKLAVNAIESILQNSSTKEGIKVTEQISFSK